MQKETFWGLIENKEVGFGINKLFERIDSFS